MVLLNRNALPQIFSSVKASAMKNVDTPTVLLLVSHSIDSLASSVMLTKLLEDELISHKVVPVTDYSELSRVYREQIACATELRSIFLINCGGILDLMAYLQAALDKQEGSTGGQQARELPHPDCRWYVIDSHRPYALENVANDEQSVVIIHDDEPNEDLDDIMEQMDVLFEGSDFEESDDEDGMSGPRAQRRRVTMAEYGSLSPDSQRERRKFLKTLVKRYYARSWHGPACSLLCYSLVQSLNKAANELLWLAIVGLTDQLVHERIEYERYVCEAQSLQAEVGTLNQDSGDDSREADGDDGTRVTVKQHISTRLRIDSVQELRLLLMRHWTVYEALQHSPYIASRLGLYQQAGREKLDIWLARMGIPLDECKQEYAYMRKQFKAPLFEKMLQYGNEFGLCHLTYPSFRCMTSYGNSQLAAADLVSGVAAVLEHYEALDANPFAGGAFAAARLTLVSATRDSVDRMMRDGLMRDAIDRAKEMLRATVAVGNAVLVGHDYINYGDFHSVRLKSGGDVARFTHPIALTKLGLFISDALREGIASLRNAPSKPLLISAPVTEADPPALLVAAVMGSARSWNSGGRNSFGNAFARAAELTSAHMAHDGFDSAVCCVAAADYDRFHEHIVLEINQM